MLVSTDTDLTFTNAMKYYENLNINKRQSTDFDVHIAWITFSLISYMMLSFRKRFDDYETMGEVFKAFKNELLEIKLVEKQYQIIEVLYQEIFAELGVDWEIFLNKLAENEISIEKLVQTQFEFLNCPIKNAVLFAPKL